MLGIIGGLIAVAVGFVAGWFFFVVPYLILKGENEGREVEMDFNEICRDPLAPYVKGGSNFQVIKDSDVER